MSKFAVAAVAAMALFAPTEAEAKYDIFTECVDADKRDNMDVSLTAHGGATESKTAFCKTGGGMGIFRKHTSVKFAKTVSKACYQLAPDSDEFKEAGCGMFTTISAANKATEEALVAAITSSIPQKFTTATRLPDKITWLLLMSNKKICVTDFDWQNAPGTLSPAQRNAIPKLQQACTKQTTVAEYNRGVTAPNADPTVLKAIKVYANTYLQALSEVAATVTPATDFASITDVRERTAKMVSSIKPHKWYSAHGPAGQLLSYFQTHLQEDMEKLILGTLAGHATFYDTHYTPKLQALKCLGTLHPQTGYNLGRLNNDVPLGCDSTSKEFKVRPACARLAVAQTLNFNRSPSLDAAAPWSLYGGKGDFKSRHTAIKMNTANFLKRAYKNNEILAKCQSAVRVHGKTGPKVIICQTHTECVHTALWHVGDKYKGCTADVEDKKEDDKVEVIGIQEVTDNDVVSVDEGGLVGNDQKKKVF